MFAIYELVESKTCSRAEICPERGGILISLTSHGQDLLYLDKTTFLDPRKNIRGGNPILFPICGQLPNCTYTWEGTAYSMKNHGVARTAAWKVEGYQKEAPGAYLTISLESNQETLQSYPFSFRLCYTYRLENGKLTIEQHIFHQGTNQEGPMPVHTGFHPYFSMTSKKIGHNLMAPTYFDYNDMTEKALGSTYDAEGKTEAVVTAANPDGSMVFYSQDNPNKKIRLTASQAYSYIMLWSVDGCDFVCVEPWTAKNQEFLRGKELLLVDPGKSIQLWMAIEAFVQ